MTAPKCSYCGLKSSMLASPLAICEYCRAPNADLSPQSVMDVLDARSRQRALSDLESITLEKAINCVDGHPEARLTKRDAARVGMKRDMSMYRTTASRSSRA